MKLEQLLSELNNRNIQLRLENNRLKYRCPTGALSEDLKNQLSQQKSAVIDHLKKNALTGEDFPLSFNQQSLWFLHSLYPQSSAYNVALAFRILSPVNMNAIQYAYDRVLQEHRALRTTYHIIDEQSGPVQRVNPFKQQKVELQDISGPGEKQVRTHILEQYNKPFDLTNGPVIRLTLFRTMPDQYIALLTVHHIACDAFSLKIILRSFFAHYRAYSRDQVKHNDQQNRHSAYTDFVADQHKLLENRDVHEKYLFFWQEYLKDMPGSIDLPRDHAYPAVPQPAGSSFYFNIEGTDYQGLVSLARDHHVSLNSVLLALFQVLLFTVTGQDDVVFGIVTSGRLKKAYLDICGYFINPLVKRALNRSNLSFKEYLTDVHNNMLQLLEYQEYPFPLLVEEFATGRDSRTTPLFQILYNYLNKQSLDLIPELLSPGRDETPVRIEDLEIYPYPVPQQEGQFELTFEVIDNGSYLYINFKHNTDLFDRKTIEAMSSCYRRLFSGVLSDVNIPLHKLISGNRLTKKVKTKNSAESRFVIAANFTIEPIEPVMKFWLEKLFPEYRLSFAPYNQVFQQLLDNGSLFNTNRPGINVIFLNPEEWRPGQDTPDAVLTEKEIEVITETGDNFIKAVVQYNKQVQRPTYIMITALSPGTRQNRDSYAFFNKIQNKLEKELSPLSGLYLLKADELNSLYPVSDYYEELGKTIGHIPYSDSYFTALGTYIVRNMFSLVHKPFKVIIVDCDNTLWDGVAAEDGLEGITIGRERKDFQEFLLAQHDAGFLICLASKNEPDDVFKVFNDHPDMILKQQHITLSKINWSLKSDNIAEIAQELNLGQDSFIFIDDNPVECSEVKARCPGVLSILLPPKNIKDYLNRIWAFNKRPVTGDDRNRTGFYQSEIKREQLLEATFSFKEFIDKLDLVIDIKDLKESEIPRASQLTQRTNQFNLTSVRMDETAVIKMTRQDNTHLQSIHVKDRFADYGMVGLIIFIVSNNKIIINTFLLSCRALGKGVEHAMLASVGRFAIKNSIEHIELELVPTERNTPIEMFLNNTIGTYKNSTVYHVPAEIINTITFNPETSTLQNKNRIQKKDVTGSIDTNDVHQILDIAQNLFDITHIQHALTEWQRKSIKTEKKQTGLPAGTGLTDLEIKLRGIWCNVLNHDNFSINDNFFDVGGRSVLIPAIVIRLKKEYRIDISIIDIFNYPSIHSLSTYINRDQHTEQNTTKNKKINKQRKALNIQKQRIKKARENL